MCIYEITTFTILLFTICYTSKYTYGHSALSNFANSGEPLSRTASTHKAATRIQPDTLSGLILLEGASSLGSATTDDHDSCVRGPWQASQAGNSTASTLGTP